MKFKELSIGEIITILTGIGLSISVIAQTYFYMRLDAIWIMSIISPTIYALDIIKIIILVIITFGGFLSLEENYRKLTRRLRLRKKIIYREDTDLSEILINNRKMYERIFRFLVFFGIWLICVFLSDFQIKTTYIFLVILGVCIAILLTLTLDKSLDKNFKRSLLGVLLILGAVGLGELKFIQIETFPIVMLTEQKSEFHKSKLLEISKTEAILLKKDEKGAFSFKIITSNQIDKIIKK